MTVGPDDARRDDERPAGDVGAADDDRDAPPEPTPPIRPSWQQAPFGSTTPVRSESPTPERSQPEASQPATQSMPAASQPEVRREEPAPTTAMPRPAGIGGATGAASGGTPVSASTGTGIGGGPGGPSGSPPYRATPQPAAQRPTGYGASPAATATTSAPRPARSRQSARRARLTVKRIDPWSVLKFSFVYSLAGVIVLLVAAAALYAIVDAMGVIDSLRTFLNDVEGGSAGLSKWLGFGRMMTIAIVIGAVNVVLFTAFATLTAFVYNVCTEIVGGVEVTLADAPGSASN